MRGFKWSENPAQNQRLIKIKLCLVSSRGGPRSKIPSPNINPQAKGYLAQVPQDRIAQSHTNLDEPIALSQCITSDNAGHMIIIIHQSTPVQNAPPCQAQILIALLNWKFGTSPRAKFKAKAIFGKTSLSPPHSLNHCCCTLAFCIQTSTIDAL